MPGKITAKEFEDKVLETEEVVIRLRCPNDQMVDSYDFSRKAADNTSLTDWLETRIKPRIGDLTCDVIDGQTFQKPHGRTSMAKLRDTYAR